MYQMFYCCTNLSILDLTNVNTQNVTRMNFMFDECRNLSNLDVSSFNTKKVETMEYMFKNCTSLTTLKTGTNFKFIETDYDLSGTWQNTAGATFTSGTFPSNVADTYTKIS